MQSPAPETVMANETPVWVLWFDNTQNSGVSPKGMSEDDYKKLVVPAGEFVSFAGFWACWENLVKTKQVSPKHCNIRVFRKGITPFWEDVQNCDGGRWAMPVEAGTGKRMWRDVVEALINLRLPRADTMNGVILSLRSDRDKMSFWDNKVQKRGADLVSDEFVKVFNLKEGSKVKYYTHKASLRFNDTLTKRREHNTNKTSPRAPAAQKGAGAAKKKAPKPAEADLMSDAPTQNESPYVSDGEEAEAAPPAAPASAPAEVKPKRGLNPNAAEWKWQGLVITREGPVLPAQAAN